MPEQTKLIYPTLDLFLYDLREELGQDAQETDENRRKFCHKLCSKSSNNSSVEDLSYQTLLAKLEEAEKSEAGFIELLGTDRVKPFERPLDGYYYPLQIGNTYALRVGCSGVYADGMKQSNYALQPIKAIQDIKQEILSHIKYDTGTIGQTWMMWCQLADTHQSPTQVALECYKQLAPNPNWERDFKAQGEFLGGTLFELWSPPSDWSDREKISENYHLLIWLFPYNKPIESIKESILKNSLDLIHLFCYRNKVIWAYSHSRHLKEELKADSLSIQATICDVTQLYEQRKPTESQMQQLREILTNSLTILSRYAMDLAELDIQGRIIESNLDHYKKQLTKIEKVEPDSDLQFLVDFGEFASAKYLQQVRMDHAHLSSGLTLQENLIWTVEGITQTSQTQRDRTLNSTIAIASVGLATSSVTATVMVAQPP
jgi:hypothetical protein